MSGPETKTIKLLQPIVVGTQTLAEVRLRAPVFADFMELGEPEFYVPVAGGKGGFIETNVQLVRSYVDRLVDSGTNMALLEGASLVDAMRLKDAVLGFFRDARMKTAPPAQSTPGSPTREHSASGTASPSAASTA